MPSITLNFTAAQAQRMQAALEETQELLDENGVPRAATAADLKYFVKQSIVRMVLASERRTAVKAADAAIQPVEIT